MDKNTNINLEKLAEIRELLFAVLETNLYLDTHPDDMFVLNLRNNFAIKLCNLTAEYQEKYGLLSAYFSEAESPWQWIEEPWPWQINYSN